MLAAVECNAGFGHGICGAFVTPPRVAYIQPKNQSTVDLTGKTGIIFRWNKVPMAAGGVHAYRFKIYKGFGYEVVVSKKLDRGVFEIEIPAAAFENGVAYTWKVQQRDDNSMNWSQYDIWNFKVVK